MGKKKNATESVPLKAAQEEAPAVEEKKEAEEPDDPPIVKELKEMDDKYLAIEREYEKEVQKLQRKYTEQQAPLLEQRKQALAKAAADADASSGTPALKGFWLTAMKHLPALEDQIEEWDMPVLEYCSDVAKSYLDSEDLHKGFKLTFHFVENPYFTNDTIWKEYHIEEASPYTGELSTTEIKVSEIDWKAGKDVTVEKVAKKVKGGGAKKNKAKGKEKEEPRDSFFRNFFRNLKPGMPLPEDVNLEAMREMEMGGEDSDDDDEAMMGLLMENDYEMGMAVRDQLVPFAVRWYTGEAQPDDMDDDDDDDDEDDEEEDDEDDSEEEDDEDDEPAPKKKAQPKSKGGAAKGGGPEGKPEECKQQ